MSRALRSAAALVIAILLLIGWAGQATAAPAAVSAPVSAAPAAAAFPTAARVEAFGQDYSDALDTVDAWWARHWSEYVSGSSYVSPGLYRGNPGLGRGIYDAPAEQVRCGPVVLADRNAEYCAVGDFLAFDVDLLDQAWAMGDAVVWFAVAHEWGHAVQARIAAPYRAAQLELQADCFAGATLQGIVVDGDQVLEPGDRDELRAAVAAFADQSPGGAPGNHGTADQRWTALTTGMNSGFAGCLPV
jgi:predicted metalloprotease